MAILIACLGEGKGTWVPVFKLANLPDWEKVIFVGPEFAKESLQLKQNMQFISVDDKQPIKKMSEELQQKIGSLFGEVGVSLFSGTGALHMALLSAILKSGGGIRLVHHGETLEEL